MSHCPPTTWLAPVKARMKLSLASLLTAPVAFEEGIEDKNVHVPAVKDPMVNVIAAAMPMPTVIPRPAMITTCTMTAATIPPITALPSPEADESTSRTILPPFGVVVFFLDVFEPFFFCFSMVPGAA